MLLPAKFQTPTPAALGAKVVAIAPAPKPHVHQWVSVPDSKIHSRCAECGTVTLTEIVAPAASNPVVSFNPRTGEIRHADGLVGYASVDPAAPGSDRTVFSEHFLGKPYSGTAAEIVAKARASERRLAAWADLDEFVTPKRKHAPATALTSQEAFEDLKAQCVLFWDKCESRDQGLAFTTQLLNTFGAKKLKDLHQSKYPAFLRRLVGVAPAKRPAA